MTQIDLSQYPAPSVLENLSFEKILGEIKTHFLSQFPTDEIAAARSNSPTRANMEALFEIEGNLIVKTLQAYAYHALQMRARVNDAAKSTMLAYATGSDLDNLAAFYMVERKANESDADLRARLILATDGFSTAGPIGAYRFHGLSAHDDVKDVSIKSPKPGEVLATVLSKTGNGTPKRAVLDAVKTALNAEDVRPLSDTISVQAASIEEYAVVAKIWCFETADYEACRQAATKAVTQYVTFTHRLGFAVTESGLKAALHQAGVQRVDLISPAATLSKTTGEAAFCTGVSVTYEGIDV